MKNSTSLGTLCAALCYGLGIEPPRQAAAPNAQLILEDKHNFIAVYNGNYDTCMHKAGPEHSDALGELRTNAKAFGMFREMIRQHWGAA